MKDKLAHSLELVTGPAYACPSSMQFFPVLDPLKPSESQAKLLRDKVLLRKTVPMGWGASKDGGFMIENDVNAEEL